MFVYPMFSGAGFGVPVFEVLSVFGARSPSWKLLAAGAVAGLVVTQGSGEVCFACVLYPKELEHAGWKELEVLVRAKTAYQETPSSGFSPGSGSIDARPLRW